MHEEPPSRVVTLSDGAVEIGLRGFPCLADDLLGLSEGHLPRFVKRYANLSREIRDALEAYAGEVRSGAFPDDEHAYAMSEEELELFEQALPD